MITKHGQLPNEQHKSKTTISTHTPKCEQVKNSVGNNISLL